MKKLLFATLFGAGLCSLVISTGCSKKQSQEEMVVEAPVIEEERPGFGSAEDQRRKAEEAAAAGTPAGMAADPEKKWGVKVSELARRLATTVLNCNDKYFKALKPDELLVGKPALVTTDGVVTIMKDDCDGILDDLQLGLLLLDGQHPKSDELLRQWTLLADMYKRVSRSAINAGAKPKRRKLNHGEMVNVLPIMTKELAPGVAKAATPFLKMGESDEPQEPGVAFAKVSKEEALARWSKEIESTTADLLALKDEYLTWLGKHWERRLKLQKLTLARVTTGDSGFDDKMKAAIGKYHAAVDEYWQASWVVGMKALEDRTMIDEEKLKAGKEGFEKGGKRLEKAVKKIKLPKA